MDSWKILSVHQRANSTVAKCHFRSYQFNVVLLNEFLTARIQQLELFGGKMGANPGGWAQLDPCSRAGNYREGWGGWRVGRVGRGGAADPSEPLCLAVVSIAP